MSFPCFRRFLRQDVPRERMMALTFPVPVTLKRFAAPRCVLSFIFMFFVVFA